MRNLLIGLVWLAIGPALWGQSTLADTLVAELCECVADSRARQTNDRGPRCLDRVGGKYEASTVAVFGLSVRLDEERAALVDTLSAQLATACPGLVPYVYGRRAWRSWSDSPTEIAYRYSFPKWNSGAAAGAEKGRALTRNLGSKELATEKTFTGVLSDLQPDGRLYLELENGGIQILYLPPSSRSLATWARRLPYTLRCRRTVGPGDRLAWQITGVE